MNFRSDEVLRVRAQAKSDPSISIGEVIGIYWDWNTGNVHYAKEDILDFLQTYGHIIIRERWKRGIFRWKEVFR